VYSPIILINADKYFFVKGKFSA